MPVAGSGRSGANLTQVNDAMEHGVTDSEPLKAARNLYRNIHGSIYRPSRYRNYQHCIYLIDLQYRYQELLLARQKPNYMTSSRTS